MVGTRDEPNDAIAGPPMNNGTASWRDGDCSDMLDEFQGKPFLDTKSLGFFSGTRHRRITSSDGDALFLGKAAQRLAKAVTTIGEQRLNEATQDADIEAAQH